MQSYIAGLAHDQCNSSVSAMGSPQSWAKPSIYNMQVIEAIFIWFISGQSARCCNRANVIVVILNYDFRICDPGITDRTLTLNIIYV